MKNCEKIKEQLSSLSSVVLRLTLAIALWPHGAQKVLGYFGGYGWEGTYQAFTQNMGIPGPLTIVAMLTEFVGPILLVLGLATRITSIGFVILMSVAASFCWENGFFINWFGNQTGNGIEYHLLFVGASLSLLLKGPGKWSIDYFICSKLGKKCISSDCKSAQ